MMKGVDLLTVKKFVGHSGIQDTMIYARLAPDHLADAIDIDSLVVKVAVKKLCIVLCYVYSTTSLQTF